MKWASVTPFPSHSVGSLDPGLGFSGRWHSAELAVSSGRQLTLWATRDAGATQASLLREKTPRMPERVCLHDSLEDLSLWEGVGSSLSVFHLGTLRGGKPLEEAGRQRPEVTPGHRTASALSQMGTDPFRAKQLIPFT